MPSGVGISKFDFQDAAAAWAAIQVLDGLLCCLDAVILHKTISLASVRTSVLYDSAGFDLAERGEKLLQERLVYFGAQVPDV